MKSLRPEGCFVRSYELDLPYTAGFFHRSADITRYEYGPYSQNVSTFSGVKSSQGCVVVGDVETCQYVLIGAVTANRSNTTLYVHKDNGRFTHVVAEQPEIRAGEEPEEMIVLQGSDWRDLMVEYADIAARKMGVKAPDTSHNSVGYCSWYYCYHNVTERQFLANLSALVAHREEFPVKYIQIDDGYQTHHGDWLERNAEWPTPLGDTVKKCSDAGLTAGIWTMPLLASTASRVFKTHPDWFVRDARGDAVIVAGWSPKPDHQWVCLDATNPEVEEHLRRIYETLYETGFRYFKHDGLGFSALQGRRMDSDSTPVTAYRRGLKIVRESVKDSIILAVGPDLQTLGLVDHVRTGLDTGKVWAAWGLPTMDWSDVDKSGPLDPNTPCLENALHSSLERWWQYDRWFRADPDVVMARQENTSLTIGEARMSALSAILTGIAFTSDRLDLMTPDRIRILSLTASVRFRGARPVDWLKKPWPSVYEGRVGDKKAAAIFNFSESNSRWSFSELGLEGTCSELLHPLVSLKDEIKLPGHDAALIVSGTTVSE